MNNIYSAVCVRVDSDESKGSGFIIKNSHSYYVVTAFHCIGNEKTTEINKNNIKIWTNEGKDIIDFDILSYYYFPDNSQGENIDLALVKIDIKNFSKKNMVENLIVSNTLIKDKDHILAGFPSCRRSLDINFHIEHNLTFSNLQTDDITMITATPTNFAYAGDVTLDKRTNAYSGSGLFLTLENKTFVSGVFFEYDKSNSVLKSVNSKQILRLFTENNLDLPLNTDSDFYNDVMNIIKDLTDDLIVVDPSLQIDCGKFKSKFDDNYFDFEELYNEYVLNQDIISKDKYLNKVIEFSLIVYIFTKEMCFDVYTLSIIISENYNKLFNSKKRYIQQIRADLNKYIYNPKFKVQDKDCIFVYDISNKDDSPFFCSKCTFSNVELNDDILNNCISGGNYSGTLLEPVIRPKKITISCGDCLDLTRLQRIENFLKGNNLCK